MFSRFSMCSPKVFSITPRFNPIFFCPKSSPSHLYRWAKGRRLPSFLRIFYFGETLRSLIKLFYDGSIKDAPHKRKKIELWGSSQLLYLWNKVVYLFCLSSPKPWPLLSHFWYHWKAINK
jgi:hypothetical protein